MQQPLLYHTVSQPPESTGPFLNQSQPDATTSSVKVGRLHIRRANYCSWGVSKHSLVKWNRLEKLCVSCVSPYCITLCPNHQNQLVSIASSEQDWCNHFNLENGVLWYEGSHNSFCWGISKHYLGAWNRSGESEKLCMPCSIPYCITCVQTI